jgi:hypothetical protein
MNNGLAVSSKPILKTNTFREEIQNGFCVRGHEKKFLLIAFIALYRFS